MQVAKVSSQGQITLPIEVRKSLGVDTGDTIVLMPNPYGGGFIIVNANEGRFVLNPSAGTRVAKK